MSTLSKFGILVGSALLGVSANFSSAAIVTFTGRTAFEAALTSLYFENFASFTGGTSYMSSSGVAFSSNGFSYTVAAEQVYNGQPSTIGLYGDATTLGVAAGNESLTVTLSSPTRAIGGQFFFFNDASVFINGSLPQRGTNLILTFNDNSTYVVPEYQPTSISNSYRGFALDQYDGRLITKLTFVAGFNSDGYATLDTLTVGSTTLVPEPASYGLIAALAGLTYLKTRRKRS